MAQVTRADSKLKFQTGDVPTQADFEDLHDSVKWYDEGSSGNLDSLTDVTITTPSNGQVLKYNGSAWVNDTDATGGGGVSDGDKGDIVVSGSGAVWTLEDAFKRSYALNIYNALGSSVIAEPLYSIDRITNAYVMASKELRLVAVWLPKDAVVTGVKWYQALQGAYTASDYNGVGLYTYSAGTLTLVASSVNDGALWKSASDTFCSKAFSSTYNAAAGLYYIGIIYASSAATTAPQLGVTTVIYGNPQVTMDFTNSAKYTGRTTNNLSLPSSLTMSSVTAHGTQFYAALY